MKKQILYSILRIIGVSIPCTFVLVCIMTWSNGEKLQNCYMPLFTETMLSFVVLCIGFSTVSIFLNMNKKIRSNLISTALSFFLIPFLVTLIFLYVFIEDLTDALEILNFLAMLLPVWFMILWEYLKFKKLLRRIG